MLGKRTAHWLIALLAVLIIGGCLFLWALPRGLGLLLWGDTTRVSITRTGVVFRVSSQEYRVNAELADGGRWLAVRSADSPAGWGLRLAAPQSGLVITNGLVVTSPGNLAFDLEHAQPRVLDQVFAPSDVQWGQAVDGLSVGLRAVTDLLPRRGVASLEVYLRNDSRKEMRLYVHPTSRCMLHVAKFHLVRPDGKVAIPERGGTMACVERCLYGWEPFWPALKPGHILGPVRLELITGRWIATGHDMWFNCSARGAYQLSIEYNTKAIVAGIYGKGPYHSSMGDVIDRTTIWENSAGSGVLTLERE